MFGVQAVTVFMPASSILIVHVLVSIYANGTRKLSF